MFTNRNSAARGLSGSPQRGNIGLASAQGGAGSGGALLAVALVDGHAAADLFGARIEQADII
ncbi:MAG TPA: hypothetical protein VNS79_09775 [Sphingobium sp.]|nr:hypothetical protein [Sphingobium sp.]